MICLQQFKLVLKNSTIMAFVKHNYGKKSVFYLNTIISKNKIKACPQKKLKTDVSFFSSSVLFYEIIMIIIWILTGWKIIKKKKNTEYLSSVWTWIFISKINFIVKSVNVCVHIVHIQTGFSYALNNNV